MSSNENIRFTATPLRLSDLPDAPRTFEHGHRWGNWLLDANRLCLCAVRNSVDDPEVNFYEIDLETITGVYWMVDWLEQLKGKGWVDAEVMGHLTVALLELFCPRSSMRDGSSAKAIEPAEVLRVRVPA